MISIERLEEGRKMDNGFITIIVAIITTLGGAKAWEFYQKKLELNREEEREDKKNSMLYRDDLRERVAILEKKLEESYDDKEKFLASIGELKASIVEFKVRIEFLEKAIDEKDKEIRALKKENSFLKKENDDLKNK